MTLLFDENLARRVVGLLDDVFPGSAHVHTLGLAGQSDASVWERARRDGFAVVSKDNDFAQRALLHGPPPKVVWLQIGNGPTRTAADLLRRHVTTLQAFGADPHGALLRLTLAD